MNFWKKWFRRQTVKIEMFENTKGKWQWRLRAGNGEILAHSEEYSSFGACGDTVKSLEEKKITN